MAPTWLTGRFTGTAAGGGASCSRTLAPALAPALKQEDLGPGARVRSGTGWEIGNDQGGGGGVKTGERTICDVRGLVILSTLRPSGTHRWLNQCTGRVFLCVA